MSRTISGTPFEIAFAEKRDRLVARYSLKFDRGYEVGSKAFIHIRTLNAYLLNHRPFADVGIVLVGKKIYSKKITERGHFEIIEMTLGSVPIAKEQ